MAKRPIKQVSFIQNRICKDCDFSVISLPNNTNLEDFKNEDYIAYCSNPECENHSGEGYLQFMPEWVIPVEGNFNEGFKDCIEELKIIFDAQKKHQPTLYTDKHIEMNPHSIIKMLEAKLDFMKFM